MKITEVVDLPLELINAQQDGNLVVFAGAGVSMGPPANYPSFVELTEQVADGSRLVLKTDEQGSLGISVVTTICSGLALSAK